ncbi:MAG: dihydrofolate reductase family protein [Eubacteriales bacterium]|nr:dihydrofolate reductase family protein [Eubacteriales bacterium]
MRNVVLFLAMSLDGYIAAPDGSVGWLGGQNPGGNDFGSYERFLAGVSDVVMGYTTYHQLKTELCPDAWPYPEQTTHVLTHRTAESSEHIAFTGEPLDALIRRLRSQQGGEIWICGGASVVNQCIQLGLIDRYHISVIPTILGDGIRLFGVLEREVPLRLLSTENYNGIVDLVYAKR